MNKCYFCARINKKVPNICIMRIKIIIFSILFGLINSIFCNPVDVNSAKNIGFVFLSSQMTTLGNADELQLAWQVSSINRGENATPYYYVFNAGNSGFVIVAADDQVLPILGYSTESAFNQTDIPTNVAAYLEEFSQQIGYVIQNDIAASSQIAREWQALRSGSTISTRSTTAVSPLLETTWNQRPYYNSLCPADTAAYGGRVPTGCVATAMSQIIRYWEYPLHGTGSHSYYANFSSDGYGDYGLQSANFATTTYQYNLMPGSINASSSANEINAVATLCYHCGIAVEMMYGPNGSGASSLGTGYHSAEYAFVHYFGYPQTSGIYRSDYSDNNWMLTLKSQLNENRPVYYAASSDDGGHAFVCDGYNASDYFHFNWGWGGSYNGYFLLSTLNPGSYNFNQNHRAIIDIYPPYTISATPSSLSFYGTGGTPTSAQSVTVSGSNLTAQISASTALPFQISNNNNNWGTTTTLDSTGGTLYVRYNPANSGTHTGTVILTSSGAISGSITLFGNACGNVTVFPWNEGFESGSMPSCWYEIKESDTLSWIYRSGGNTYPSSPHTGSYNAYFYAGNHNGNTTKLVTPELNLSGMNNPQLSFWHTQKIWGTDQDNLNVYYRTTPSGSWILLRSYSNNISSWTQESINLPGSSSTYYIAFEGVADYGYGVALDDISVADNTTSYTITATAGQGGSITPDGANAVFSGGNLNFTITSDSLYSISDVLIDNVSAGAVTSYNFTNVVSNHTIAAFFVTTPVPTISTNVSNLSFEGTPGIPTTSQYISVYGIDLSTEITVFADEPFQVLSNEYWGSSTSISENGGMLYVRYNPASTGTDNGHIILTSSGAPTVTISLTGTASIPVYTITAYTNDGGSISPEGVTNVTQGDSITYHLYPNEGYHILYNLVDGEIVGSDSTYTFTNVTDYHIILALFESNTAINDINEEDAFILYPNPASDYIEIIGIGSNADNVSISIIDLTGKLLKTISCRNSKTTIDISELSGGIYFIKIEGKNILLTKKFVKK